MLRRGPLTKLVSGAIGLTQEYRADRKERKAHEQALADDQRLQDAPNGATAADHSQHTSESSGGFIAELPGSVPPDYSPPDAEEWARDLDEVQQLTGDDKSKQQQQGPGSEDGGGSGSNSNAEVDVDRLLHEFTARHPLPPPPYPGCAAPQNPLAMPVIIPQRRPENKAKGFVRAYAPVLEGAGIGEEAWMDFLDSFERSISGSGWFGVANIAVAVAQNVAMATAGFSPAIFLVASVVHMGVEGARRGYVQFQQNKFLDSANELFFKPRGLFCLIAKHKPDSGEPVEQVDIRSNVTRSVQRRDGQNPWTSVVRSTALTTSGEAEVPEPAPLVFPRLDRMSETQKQNAFKQFGSFVSDYHDRQAAAKFEGANPDSKIPSAPRKEFASRFSDPNHPTNKGGLISAVTGWDTSIGGRGARGGRGGGVLGIGVGRSYRHGLVSGDRVDAFVKGERSKKIKNNTIKRVMKQDALYLMVVNMPTQEELDLVAAELARLESQ